jgi:hypothetical protein
MSDAHQSAKDWRDEIEITPEMIDAGEAVLAELDGEVSRSTLAKEVFWAMEYVRRCPQCDKLETHTSP